jgi:hypothetical protein
LSHKLYVLTVCSQENQLFRAVFFVHLFDESTLAHDQYPAGQGYQLWKIRGDENDRVPRLGEPFY